MLPSAVVIFRVSAPVSFVLGALLLGQLYGVAITPGQIVGPPPSANAEAARTPRETVILLHAPAVRAVFRTVGSGRDAEIVVVPEEDGKSTECSDSHTTPVRSATSVVEPDLAWVPSGGATP